MNHMARTEWANWLALSFNATDISLTRSRDEFWSRVAPRAQRPLLFKQCDNGLFERSFVDCLPMANDPDLDGTGDTAEKCGVWDCPADRDEGRGDREESIPSADRIDDFIGKGGHPTCRLAARITDAAAAPLRDDNLRAVDGRCQQFFDDGVDGTVAVSDRQPCFQLIDTYVVCTRVAGDEMKSEIAAVSLHVDGEKTC